MPFSISFSRFVFAETSKIAPHSVGLLAERNVLPLEFF